MSSINEEILALANSESGSGLGTGGIKSKIQAAKSCLNRDAEMILVSKDQINQIHKFIKNPEVTFSGTRFIK